MLSRPGFACRQLEGWTLDAAHADDPRTPVAGESITWLRPVPGPWQQDGRPAHGIFSRPAEHGLTDWVAAIDGWVIWRWSGPRMSWTSPLVSPWNPILAQMLTLGPLVDVEDGIRWTAEAVRSGRKPAGYLGLRPCKDVWRWVQEARAAGIVVWSDHHGCCARPGTLNDHYDLSALAAEYQRVLPAELAEVHLIALAESGDDDLLTAVENFEDYPAVIGGLALGYPPEVTAGGILARGHAAQHKYPGGWEEGAYCMRCRRTHLSATVGPRRRLREDLIGSPSSWAEKDVRPVG